MSMGGDSGERLREELGALLDGELAPEREAELRERLANDDELRREFDELRRSVEAFRALPAERAPDSLRAGVWNRIDAGADAQRSDSASTATASEASAAGAPRGRIVAWPATHWVTAAAGVLLCVAVLAWWRGRDATPSAVEHHAEQTPEMQQSDRAEKREAVGRDGGAKTAADTSRTFAGAREEREGTPAPGAGKPAEAAKEAVAAAAPKPGKRAQKLDATGKAAGDKGAKGKTSLEKSSGDAGPPAPRGKKRAPLPPVVVAAEQARQVSAKQLREYLQAVRNLPQARLREHIRAVAGVDSGQITVGARPARGVVLAERADALLVREVLWRAHVAEKGSAPASVVPARRRHLDLTLRLTAAESVAVSSWLQRLPAAKRQAKSRGETKRRGNGEPRKARSGDGRTPVVFRLGWSK